MKININKLKSLIRETIYESKHDKDVIDHISDSPAGLANPGLRAFNTIRNNPGRASLSDAAPALGVMSIFGVGLVAAIMYGSEMIEEHANEVAHELSEMTAIEIERELNYKLPDGFKQTLINQGTSTHELAIQIEQMDPDQIRDALEMKIQYDIEYGDTKGMTKQEKQKARSAAAAGSPAQSPEYELGEPLMSPRYGGYPDFKYDD